MKDKTLQTHGFKNYIFQLHKTEIIIRPKLWVYTFMTFDQKQQPLVKLILSKYFTPSIITPGKYYKKQNFRIMKWIMSH